MAQLFYEFFTITAGILALSLANFHCQRVNRHMNLYLMLYVNKQEGDNLTICYRKKQIDVRFCVCPVIDNEFRHNIVKVVCQSTRLTPRESTTTLTML